MVYLAKCCHSDVSSVRRAEYPLEILNSADSFTMQNKRQQFCWTFFSISTSLKLHVMHLLLQWFDATFFYSVPNIDRCYQCLFILRALYMFKSWKDKSAVCSKGKRLRWRRKWSTRKNRGTTNNTSHFLSSNVLAASLPLPIHEKKNPIKNLKYAQKSWDF